MEWDEDMVARLRGFWDAGHSTAEIGRRLGVSKNAVVGKAHRLALPPRPSPIRRDAAAPRGPQPPRVSGPTLPPVGAPEAEPHAEAQPARNAPPASPRAAGVLRSVPIAAATRISPCCWPIGEPGTPSFRFCDAPAQGGKPYCAEHAQLAYVRVRDRRDDAA